MLGDRTLFTRAEGIERLWEVADAAARAPPPVQPYAQGTWGPAAADALVAPQAMAAHGGHGRAGVRCAPDRTAGNHDVRCCLKAEPWRHVLEQETWTVMPSTPGDPRPIYYFPLRAARVA